MKIFCFLMCTTLLFFAGCGKSGVSGGSSGPSDDQIKTALQIDPNYAWQSFKAESSPIAEINGTSTKPGSLRIDVTGTIAPPEDLFVVVQTSVNLDNDYTDASRFSPQDQGIFGKAQKDEQVILNANDAIHLRNIVSSDVKLYPLPAWPANLGSLIQAQKESLTVAAQVLAEPTADGKYTCSIMQKVIPYKSMDTLTPRSKMPSGTVIVGSPEWNAIAAKMQTAAAATKQPLQ